ncbi:MAG TPA: FtsW/RodA/SpoVE family cell cycle protein, partial [Lachnospiraceae bacterium]
KEDFVFAAICEELGGIFAVCLILICMSLFILILNISMQFHNPFYKMIALGFGVEYAFQVFLTIGGTSKFIPMTGITLPLVSYGGSSILCTILMLSVVQGLYMLREDEGDYLEQERWEGRYAKEYE